MVEHRQGADDEQEAPNRDADAFRIFLNYRRQDADTAVGRLWDTLTRGLGGESGFAEDQIFKDIDTIEPGVDFRNAIRDAVASSDVFLAVIGREWLSAADAKGRRRLDNPADFVRIEIEAALHRAAERDDVRVVPTLVQGAEMPSVEELPEPLSALAHRNAVELTDARWPYDAGRLLARLKELEREKVRRIAAAEEAAALGRQREAAEQAERERAEREQEEREQEEGDREARERESGRAHERAAEDGGREQRKREADGLRQGRMPLPWAKRSRRTRLSLSAGGLVIAAGVTVIGVLLWPSDPSGRATWMRSDLPSGVSVLRGVAAVPDGETIAVGGGKGRPRVLVRDGGSAWSEETVVSGNGGMNAVAASETEAVAGGFVHDDEDVDGEIWKRDGNTWKPVCKLRCADAASQASGRQGILALTATKSGSFVAVGRDRNDAAVWFSRDGSRWDRRGDNDDDLRGADNDVRVMNGVTSVGDRRLVAVGRRGLNGAVWWSDDEGDSWTMAERIPVSDGSEQVGLTAVAWSSSSRVVAVGYKQVGRNSAVAWISTDSGSTWEEAEVLNASARGQKIDGVVWSGSIWTAVGQDRPDGSRIVAAVWSSADGAAWQDVRSDSFADGSDPSMAATAVVGGRTVAVGAGIWTSDTSE